MERPIFTNNSFYHVYNRGVDKRDIFLDEDDYYRCIHDLYEFNDEEDVLSFSQPVRHANAHIIGSRTPDDMGVKPRKKLVKILSFCLMPNHYHLLAMQLKGGGITKFMRKLGTGYTNSFNLKYERSGHLFQGKFKAIHVDSDSYLTHLTRYIHLNPLDLIEPHWKERGVSNWDKSSKFLKNYRWSSYPDFIGEKNFPSVTDRNFLNNYFDESRDYESFIKEWAAKDLEDIKDMIID